jgi:ribosomal protein S18 acetylase RimI-like enzyme
VLVKSARESELSAALEIVFRHLSGDERETRVQNAFRLIKQGELDPAGIIVARENDRLAGALVCLPVPGASALVWPPQAIADTNAVQVEDQLLIHGKKWLLEFGVKLAQALLVPRERHLANALLRHGFGHITNLQYLRHDAGLDAANSGSSRYTYQTYRQCDPSLFHSVLMATYTDTLDCPEVNGIREVNEIIEGHRSQGVHDPDRWWLAFDAGQPVAVLLLTEVPEWNGWDLSYVGVVPAFRRRGIGKELTRKALQEARMAGAGQLTLALDVRNTPASQLYTSLGFAPFDEREVYLAIWKSAAGTTKHTHE